MTPLAARSLDAFPNWLRSLGQDARNLAAVVEDRALPAGARRSAALALNYLFKSLDLVPDGLEDLGFVDDAFVFRVAAASASPDEQQSDPSGTLARLAEEIGLVREFMSDVYPRLEGYVAGLADASSRGRSVSEVLSDDAVLAEFVRDAKQWADGYQPPSFARDEKNLVKLKAFLAARLK
ncbi:MAG TPA: YkvA family protein [Polyangiaceae bacterium]